MGDEVEITDACGCVLVRDTSMDGGEHRYWFDTTRKNRLVFVEEVIELDERFDGDHSSGRHFVDIDEADVPKRIGEELHDFGFTKEIVDVNGKVLVEAAA